MLVVKAKLYSLFNKNDEVRAPVMLRLGFHDCLKYTDGSGGCDGCLNWEGVGYRYEKPEGGYWNFSLPNVDKSNNNGLEDAVALLERIYTEPDFPIGRAPSLSISLRDSGKSRADLWAFSAIAAVEYTTETNNKVCEGNFDHNPGVTCNYKVMNGKSCHIDFPSQIKFQTGRKDCTEQILELPYQTSKEETHPRVVGNGKDTTDFFLKEFGFNGRETVAIMGGHTIGHFNQLVSLFIYTWTGLSRNAFNNDYYGNLASGKKISFLWEDKNCVPQTDAEGREGAGRWVTNVRFQTENGGPAFWIHETYRCVPECSKPNMQDHYCCSDLQPGQYCKPDSDLMEDDPDGLNMGCERSLLIQGADEMAINSEIGLYFDFQVTDDGMPYGCPNLEGFTTENFKRSHDEDNSWTAWSVKPGAGGAYGPGSERYDPECPLQTLAVPEGSTPLHQIVEEYAEDQDAFIRDFIPTLEKMLSNGYDSSDLQDSEVEYSFDTVNCNRPPVDKTRYTGYYISCIPQSSFDEAKPFVLMPLVADEALAVQGEENGHAIIAPFDLSDDTQAWITAPGNQIVNQATKIPLRADSGTAWVLDETNPFIIRNSNDDKTVLTALCYGCKLVIANQPGNEGYLQYFAAIPKDELKGQDVLQTLKDKAAGMDFFGTLTRVEDQPKYRIRSQRDNRVIDLDRVRPWQASIKQFMNSAQDGNLSQMWVLFETSTGTKIMNVDAKDLLQATNEGIYEWVYDEDAKVLLDSTGSGKVLKRGKANRNGAGIGIGYKPYNGRNVFVFELIDH